MKRPTALLLDVTRRCNAACPMCGRLFWPNKPPPDMDRALALRLIELPYIDRVCLGQYGEPTLWPHLADAVRKASDLSKYVWTTTNGQLLTSERSWELLDAGIDKIIVSIDAIDPEVYDRIRVNLNWYTVLRNLDALVTLRNNDYRTRIVVNCTRTPENRSRTDSEIKGFFLGHGVDGVAFTPEIDVSPRTGVSSGPPIDCERPYDHLTVRCDGALMLCCRDCHQALGDLGSVETADPLRVYNSETWKAIRRALETGKDVPNLCRGCRAHWPDRRKPVRY